MKRAKKNITKKSVRRPVARKKTVKSISKKTTSRATDDEDEKAHKAALKAAKKQGRISAAIGIAVETFSGVTKRITFPGTNRKAVEIPVEAIRNIRSTVTGETITLIHNGVARLSRLTEQLDFRVRDPRNVQYVRLNTEGLSIK